MEGVFFLVVILIAPFLLIPFLLHILFKNSDRLGQKKNNSNIPKNTELDNTQNDAQTVTSGVNKSHRGPLQLILFIALGAAIPSLIIWVPISFDSTATAADVFFAVIATAFWVTVGIVVGAVIWNSSGNN
jgi:hypothetical protein